MRFEQLKEHHLDKLLEMERECFSIPWTKNMFLDDLKNPLSIYYIAVKDEACVGYMGMWHIGEEGHITNIAVSPRHRRQKVGEGLLNYFIAVARAKGIVSLTLEVRKSNAPAIALYRKLGFEEVGFRKGYYADNNEDALIMTLQLPDK